MNWNLPISCCFIFRILIYLAGTTLGNRCGDVATPERYDNQIFIRYIPGPDTNYTVRNYNKNCGFRWLWEKGTSLNVVNIDIGKYHLQNLSLVIRDVTSADAKTYYVQCHLMSLDGICRAVNTNRVIVPGELVNPPVSTTPGTTLSTEKESPSLQTDNDAPILSIKTISTIVVSVCVVLTVAIVSGTVLAVLKHKREKQDGTTKLVGPEAVSSSAHAGHSSESIYNEIDVPVQLPVSKLAIQNSPKLPARPGDRNIKIGTSGGSEYASIDESKMIDGTIKNEKTDQKWDDGDTVSRGNYCQFVVKFPEINCDSITQNLNQNCSSESDPMCVYATVSKGQKRRKSRVKSSELKYITIDHTVDLNCWHGNDGQPDRSQLTKEYAAIDFDRKAFVAPIRKAPSSWYKRKRRNR